MDCVTAIFSRRVIWHLADIVWPDKFPSLTVFSWGVGNLKDKVYMYKHHTLGELKEYFRDEISD
jgi:hypothetical protein